MSLIEALPDSVLCHIVALIISELRKLPCVCSRFRDICMMPHWFTKFVLELNPTRFVNVDANGHGHGATLSFQRGAKHRVFIENPWSFVASESGSDSDSVPVPSSLPWRDFSVFDLELVPNRGATRCVQQCIELILPHFESLEISPSTKRQSDVVLLSEALFCRRRWDNVVHLSLNGKVQFEADSDSNSNLDSAQSVGPGLRSLFSLSLRRIEYLELNSVCYPERDWISESISSLKQLVILDLWRCQWRAQSVIALSAQIELFRVFGCTVGTRFDFRRCADRIRVVSTDCPQCTASPSLLLQTSRLMAHHENGERVQFMISHIRSTSQCLLALKAMMRADIDRLHIVYSRDMFKVIDELQDAVEQTLSRRSTRNRNQRKGRNHKMDILRQNLEYDVLSEDDHGHGHDHEQQYGAVHAPNAPKTETKRMTVVYSKLSVNLFAASKHYALFRKLLKIGRLRDTFLWEQETHEM